MSKEQETPASSVPTSASTSLPASHDDKVEEPATSNDVATTRPSETVSVSSPSTSAPIDYTKKESDLPTSPPSDPTAPLADGPSPTEAVSAAISSGSISKRPSEGGRARNGAANGGPAAGGPSQYLNPTRHLTGGPARSKLSASELDAKIQKARLQNEAILQRRALVERDKDQYSALTERERLERKERARKLVEDKKVQLAIDEERNKNRERKLEKVDRRQWDSEKAGQDALWQTNYKEYTGHRPAHVGGGGSSRGRGAPRGEFQHSGAGGGRGRGRGRGGGAGSATRENQRPAGVDLKDTELFPALPSGTGKTSQEKEAKAAPVSAKEVEKATRE